MSSIGQVTALPSKRSKNAAGAPRGNFNGYRHGLRAARLPPKCAYIRKQTNYLRRVLEDAVIALRGDVSVTDCSTINAAMRWEVHSLLCSRWLALAGNEMGHADRIAFSRDVARASSERDKLIRSLGLDARTHADVWGTIVEGQVVAREAASDARES